MVPAIAWGRLRRDDVQAPALSSSGKPLYAAATNPFGRHWALPMPVQQDQIDRMRAESLAAIDLHNQTMRRSERYAQAPVDDGLWRNAAQIMLLTGEIRRKAA